MDVAEVADGEERIGDAISQQDGIRGVSHSLNVQLSKDDPFDLESYISNYSGQTKISRLVFIARSAPTLRATAAQQAMQLYRTSTLDTHGYQVAASLRNSLPDGQPLAQQDRVAEDSAWLTETSSKARQEGEKLDLELRNYQNNLIKESIRMAHRDLGDHFRRCGHTQEALKCYQRTRDFCSTSEHIVEMCISATEVALELHDYRTAANLVGKAEGVLESYNPAAAAAGSGNRSSAANASSSSANIGPPGKGGSTSGADAIGALFRAGGSSNQTRASNAAAASASSGGSDAAQTRLKREVAQIAAKLQVTQGLALMGLGLYEAAANSFLSSDAQFSEGYNHVISAADVALYGILCSLAVFPRSKLQTAVLEKTSFRAFMEYEPHSRELLDAFWACDYKKTFSLLDKWKSRHLLDIYLHPHIETLHSRITRRALQQFFRPFDRVPLSRLCELFGWSESQARAEVLDLVESRGLDAKLDWVEGVVQMNKSDPRSDLFENTFREGQRRLRTAEKVAWRMELIANGLTYREQREQGPASPPPVAPKGAARQQQAALARADSASQSPVVVEEAEPASGT